MSSEGLSYLFVMSKLHSSAPWSCSPKSACETADGVVVIPFLTAKLSTSSFKTLPSFPVPWTSVISILCCFARLLTAGVDKTPACFPFSRSESRDFVFSELPKATVVDTDSLSNSWSESGDFAFSESPKVVEGFAESSTDIFKRVAPT